MAISAPPVLTLTAHLTPDEREIFEAFAAEHQINDPADAFRAMLHELVRLHEALWDEQFAHSVDVLEEMGRKALESYTAGVTEEFDPDDDADAP